jgi:hypothetical protein
MHVWLRLVHCPKIVNADGTQYATSYNPTNVWNGCPHLPHHQQCVHMLNPNYDFCHQVQDLNLHGHPIAFNVRTICDMKKIKHR